MERYKYKIKRRCEECGKIVINRSNSKHIFVKAKFWKAHGLRRWCKSCSNRINMTGKKASEETKQKMRDSHLGIKQSAIWIKRRLSGKNNPALRPGHRERMLGNKNPAKRPEVRVKIRESVVQYNKEMGKCRTRFGKNETQILNEQEKKNGIKIQRQYHIVEFGYVVDGYCKETNTVYEVYENHHKRQWRKDLVRQRRIMKRLGCKFIIIRDN